MNYSELKAQIADSLHRSDLTAQIPGFIARAEALLFREISVKGLEIAVTGVTSGGSIALPSDCATVGRITTTYGGKESPLDYDPAPAYNSGLPLTYTLEAGALKLDSATDGYAYTLYYTPTLAPLSDSNTTNWLLTNAQDLYLMASMVEAARWTEDEALEQRLFASLPAMIDSVRRLIDRTGQPARGGMQIKPRNTR